MPQGFREFLGIGIYNVEEICGFTATTFGNSTSNTKSDITWETIISSWRVGLRRPWPSCRFLGVHEWHIKALRFKRAEKFEVMDRMDAFSYEKDAHFHFQSAGVTGFCCWTRGRMSLLSLLIVIVVTIALRVFHQYCVAYKKYPNCSGDNSNGLVWSTRTRVIWLDASKGHCCWVQEKKRKFQLDKKGHFGISSREGFPEVEGYKA